ncbi:hypothetical protein CXB51_021219 [Gossypium anomalum]|uniref:Protein N-terminal asparagine amidohydrolase n=1 Tax=Gossypium anomalum TaxID=47600 RepID=A0A8J5YRW0_9ROSI|nr:hypothetical protein CXB51_021219 [Gossypium anomalum]
MIFVDGLPFSFNSSSSSSSSSKSQPSDLLVALMEHQVLVSATHSFKSIQERKVSASMDSKLITSSNSSRYVYLFQREYATVDPSLVHKTKIPRFLALNVVFGTDVKLRFLGKIFSCSIWEIIFHALLIAFTLFHFLHGKYVGTDEATTCVGVVIRNRKNGMTSVSHMDSPKIVDIGFSQMLALVVDHNLDADLDVHLVGAFEDVSPNHASGRSISQGKRDGYSIPLCRKIVETMQKRPEKFHVKTLCVLRHNTKYNSQGNALPIFNGLLVETSSGTLIPASFDKTSRCPDEIVRRLRVSSSYEDPSWQGKLLDTYDTKADRFIIAPCRICGFECAEASYLPIYELERDYGTKRLVQIVLSLQSLSDSEILASCSTSPLAEGPEFVDNERRLWNYLIKNPDWRTTFPMRQPRVFERTGDGGWKRAGFSSQGQGTYSTPLKSLQVMQHFEHVHPKDVFGKSEKMQGWKENEKVKWKSF